MNYEVLTVQFLSVKNCFLHLSVHHFRSLVGPTVCGIKLITSDGRELYFSPSGAPFPSLNGNNVGISQTFAKVIGLKENESVIISPLYNLGSLQSVHVTPKTEGDFEILHSAAVTVESSLLNQLRIVWPKQAFPVWVSTNISVTLVVDSISPNLKYGRLEEYSEVIVASVIPKNGNKKATAANSDVPSSVPQLVEEIKEPNYLKFRCVPNISTQGSKFYLHPYVVFAQRNFLPEWALNLIELKGNTVWRLTKCGNDVKSVVVTIEFSDLLEPGHCSGFRKLFISPLLKNHLDLNLGHKVILKLISSEGSPESFGVLVSSLSSSTKEEDKLIDEVHKTFFQAISSCGKLLLNTKAPFPLNDGNAMLTLRPLDATWGFISSQTLAGLSINVNKFVSDTSVSLKESELEDQYALDNYIPGFEEILETGKITLELNLAFQSGTNKFSDNIIYTGKSGSGKTTLLKCLYNKVKGPPYFFYCKYVSCCSLKGKRVEALSKYFSEVLQMCCLCEPSVLFLDNIDFLACISEENTEASFHINRISHKITELIDSYQKKNCILVVASAKSLDNVNPQISSSKGKCLFTTNIVIPDLSKEDRLQLVKKIFSSKSNSIEPNLDYDYISNECEGYTALDLKRLCDKAVFEAWQRKVKVGDSLIITNKDVESALAGNKPSSLHQVNFYRGKKISWKDVGGLKIVKEKLIEVVCWPTRFPDIISQCPVRPQTGVLLYGFPGSGKTLLASALAGESKMNFISIKGPELMSKYIGESEEGVRKLFEKAQAARPCLLFFDEFDSLAPRRGQDQTGVTDRVVNQLLTALDGVDPMSGVWVIAATSRPDLIDPAILRPGRIGISIHCTLPDQEGRREIINSICSKINLSKDIDLQVLSELTEGFSGADIKGLFTSAQIKALDALHEEKGFLNAETDLENDSLPLIELHNDCLLMALQEMRPSLSENEKKRYQAIYSNFEKHTPVKIQEQKVTHA